MPLKIRGACELHATFQALLGFVKDYRKNAVSFKVRGGHAHGQVKVFLSEFSTQETDKLLHPCPLCNIIGHLAADGLSIMPCGQGGDGCV